MDTERNVPEDRAEEWAGDFDPFSDQEERRVLFAALDSFSQYRKRAHYNTTHRRRQSFYAMRSSHWQSLASPPFNFLDALNKVDDAIDANADLAQEILSCGLQAFGLSSDPEVDDSLNWRGVSSDSDFTKAHSTLRQFYRDWSDEGASERQLCYGPVLNDLSEEFGDRPKADLKVLVPGAGLGRLVYEICLAGYDVEGNEISYHQLLASSWVLNHTLTSNCLPIYPFAAQFSNVLSRKQQLQKVMIPDVAPSSSPSKEANIDGTGPIGRMSMTAADFVVLYGDSEHEKTYNAVTTVFFIDTAPNLIRYIESIRNCLVPGGIWINLGPLLWHSNDPSPDNNQDRDHNGQTKDQMKAKIGIGEPGSIELTVEESIILVEQMGFKVETHDISEAKFGYIQDPESMLQHLYRVSHWVARKVG